MGWYNPADWSHSSVGEKVLRTFARPEAWLTNVTKLRRARRNLLKGKLTVGERTIHIRKVGGSSPPGSTTYESYTQA